MAAWTITAVRPTRTPDGWYGARQIPAFSVEALTCREALVKAAEVLGSGEAGMSAWCEGTGEYGEGHACDGTVVPAFVLD